VAAIAFAVATAAPAGADAPGPTDYRSRVVAITPRTSAVRARIVGGDSFVELSVERGHRVTVIGYRGEPYVRVLADGRVEENEHSPSTYLNRNRFGDVTLPRSARADATPSWRVVATDGDWTWHDHRTHWMSPDPPLGRHPGQQILDGSVPLRVDGRHVDVRVTSTWEPRPSLLPSVLAIGAGLASAVLALRHPPPAAAMTLAVGALAALVAGGWQTWSLPTATGPSPLLWILPATAAVSAIAALVQRSAASGTAPLIGAACLATWAALRIATLWRPVLPTSAPYPLDRILTALAGAVGATILIAGLLALSASLWGPPHQRSDRM
jgi:hypothetical protein